ncbi:hypothetical protein [Pseudorhodoplanes sp.]|uniref:hypothetical protein n=1 Tax=Pseudorhodoplanes sp. TaxID=1934341 RepID=UPI003D136B66
MQDAGRQAEPSGLLLQAIENRFDRAPVLVASRQPGKFKHLIGGQNKPDGFWRRLFAQPLLRLAVSVRTGLLKSGSRRQGIGVPDLRVVDVISLRWLKVLTPSPRLFDFGPLIAKEPVLASLRVDRVGAGGQSPFVDVVTVTPPRLREKAEGDGEVHRLPTECRAICRYRLRQKCKGCLDNYRGRPVQPNALHLIGLPRLAGEGCM